ncbi:hypothetical protein BGW36DRAFT_370787 [Talaromyces proteolyticus]|uniref:Pentatricopeptide repeat domain-containing protein n=1 Tax=Talaromyces proteolyticus TaxID=1131652 RepID=A0AAD4L3X5_9EURO|nr:uncharacterized protein BGW36DRAFT_370787 [Talaromyces proteolyticus]KAH8704169.1 hypothetical protein BGW36DRAFT_370787 [Talaromyces proteolyticus]
MRPALLRLLKRPSALALLSELSSSSAKLEQLNCIGECARCQLPQKNARQLRSYSSPTNRTSTSQRLHIHEITSIDTKTLSRISSTELQRESSLLLDASKLEYESDVGHPGNIGTRLVDDSNRRLDYDLWKELLRYRKRHYGDSGVIDIWKGISYRADKVQLPVEGRIADYIWQNFVNVGLKNNQFLDELVDYAEKVWSRTGQPWSRFYQAIVGGFLEQGMPVQAVAWHRKLQAFHLRSANDIALVIDQAMTCNPVEPPDWDLFSADAIKLGFRPGLRAFGEICLATTDHRIYDVVISFLLEQGYPLDALYMHEFLVERKDLPSDATLMRTLSVFAKKERDTFSRKVRHRIRKIKTNLDTLQDEFAMSKKAVDLNLTTGHERNSEQDDGNSWIKERAFKDEFGARLFATKALTVDTITNGLQMFGVQAIGPLSLKEMALRAKGPKDILEKMKALRDAGVTIRDCAFTRVLEKLAMDNKDIVLEDLLRSDQHPDVFEDVALQEHFLCSYLMARDWRLYNLTKAILNDVAKDNLDNIQFRVSITASEWSAAADIAGKILLDGNALSEESINYMFNNLLSPRRSGKHPAYKIDPQVDEMAFAIRILKMALKLQSDFNPSYWVELLLRLGKNRHDQWDKIHHLCVWLARHYAVQDSPFLQSLSRSKGVDAETLLAKHRTESRLIFNPRLQMALIAWGFKLELWHLEHEMPDNQGGQVIRWMRGLLLLRELEQMGITIYPSFVRRGCRERLQVLFGAAGLSNRPWNRSIRQRNPFTLSHVLEDMLKVWPSLLTEEEKADVYNNFIDRPLLGRTVRRMEEQLDWLQQPYS